MSTKNRKNIALLTDGEVLALRKAYAGIMALPDDDPNSYTYLASIHGGGYSLGNNGFCVHNDPDGNGFGFLCWHRKYIEKFEKALQRIVPDIKLPYWDWFTKNSVHDYAGFPKIFTEENYIDEHGKSVHNPLFNAKGRNKVPTQRKAKLINNSRELNWMRQCEEAEAENWSQNILEHHADGTNGFDEATRQEPHNYMHYLIGGDEVSPGVGADMSYPGRAAYDPIFWVHHANVDRLWASWQKIHPNAKIGANVADTNLVFPNGEIYKPKDVLAIPDYDHLEQQPSRSHLRVLAMRSAPKKTPKKLTVHVQSNLAQAVGITVKGQEIGHVAIFGDPPGTVSQMSTKEEAHDHHGHHAPTGGHSHATNGEKRTFDVSDLEDFDEKDVDVVPSSTAVPKPNFTVKIH